MFHIWNRKHPRAMTVVYRLHDDAGTLLYVGATGDFDARFAQHRQSKPWWRDVARKEVIWFDNRLDAEYEEARAIRDEHPVHNERPGIKPLALTILRHRTFRDGLTAYKDPAAVVSASDIEQYFVHEPWWRDDVLYTMEGVPAGVSIPYEMWVRGCVALGETWRLAGLPQPE